MNESKQECLLESRVTSRDELFAIGGEFLRRSCVGHKSQGYCDRCRLIVRRVGLRSLVIELSKVGLIKMLAFANGQEAAKSDRTARRKGNFTGTNHVSKFQKL